MTQAGATENVVEAVATKVADEFGVITELVDNTNMTYILAALVVGAVIGIGIVLMMDNTSDKLATKLADEIQNELDNQVG